MIKVTHARQRIRTHIWMNLTPGQVEDLRSILHELEAGMFITLPERQLRLVKEILRELDSK